MNGENNKLTQRIKRSNARHLRLAEKNSDLHCLTTGKAEFYSGVKENYHERIAKEQAKQNRLLNKTERKKIYTYELRKFALARVDREKHGFDSGYYPTRFKNMTTR